MALWDCCRISKWRKDIRKVIDVAYVEERAAWDEYEDICRYMEYTESELQEIHHNQNKPTLEERIEVIESAILEMILGGDYNGGVSSGTN